MTLKKNNLLICVVGLTPQIVTETLYCLTVQQNKEIDEIYIFTTSRGREVLLGRDKDETTSNKPLIDEIKKLCKKYKIKKPRFANTQKHIITAVEESVELSDIRTDEDNKLFPNKITEFVKEKTADPFNVLYCSISGGRKTMSVHLANALSLFGREQDKLLHVLTSKEFEFKDFFPKNLREDRALTISEIPFVRLRSLSTPDVIRNKSYIEVVEYSQKKLRLLTGPDKLLIYLAEKIVKFGDKSVSLEPMEMVVYLKFVEKRISGSAEYSIDELQSVQFALQLKRILEEKFNHYFDSLISKNHWSKKGLEPERFRTLRAKINNKLKNLFEDDYYFGEFAISSKKKWKTVYSIKAPKEKLGINYE